MNNKGKVYVIVPILVVTAILIAYFFGWKIGAHLNKDRTAYNITELAILIGEDIDNGKDSGTFYVTGITTKELVSINDYVCSTNGVVEQYSIYEKSYGGMKVSFRYDISDNYYVIQKYKNGTEIPNDRPEAYKLYDKTVEIIDTIITPGMTDYEKELAIHDYIVKNCQYGYVDYSQEYAYRAYGVLVQGKAVCNGYAEAMSLLLSCVDVENYIMVGEAYSENGWELHAWNAVCLDGEWYQVDATWNDPLPDRGFYAGHTYFNVTDDIMDDTHKWDEEVYDDCNNMSYNYYEYNDLITNEAGLFSVVSQVASRNIAGTVEAVVTDYNEKDFDWQFVFGIPGINSFEYTVDSYGNDHMVTIYLNQSH